MDDERAWFSSFVEGLPCPECRQHFEQFIRSQPPDFEDRGKFFAWTVAAHNFVNRSNDKPEMPSALAQRIHAFEPEV